MRKFHPSMSQFRRLSDSAGPSVFSVLAAAHANGAGILVFVSASTRDVWALRLVSRELLGAVAAFPWSDSTTLVSGSVALWRSCFPRAIAINLRSRLDLKVTDFELLSGVLELDLTESEGESVALGHFARYCSSLTSLNLEGESYYGSVILTDEGVLAIAQHCSHLTYLNMTYATFQMTRPQRIPHDAALSSGIANPSQM